MSVFKCKMCGGTIRCQPGESVGVCDSCGTKQTLPRLDSERKQSLFDRADHYRRNYEYDKAMALYERILEEGDDDAEVYWSLVLCRYGIEYVEDPASHKRIPTVNRAQYTSILADANYKAALRYADGYQKVIYEEEANAIDEIQEGILKISRKEEPFDVFICYKETDHTGRRTPDSVLATELYHELTKVGYKVFFSRITLEDKLGTEYEPYIFAALNSAKVMVAVGTKPEYYNAVWVKNEWSRYLALIKNGAKKVLIPAYRDMDPYDLPEEFSHLQAQDMSKLGFMQDLIRGIQKIIDAQEAEEPVIVKEMVVVSEEAASIESLLKRAFLFLEDGDWEAADRYSERILDRAPENGEAYLVKLMADMQVRKREDLGDQYEPFDEKDIYQSTYQKILRFGDEKLIAEIKGYNEQIHKRIEEEKKEALYYDAIKLMKNAKTAERYVEAARVFQMIEGYRDSNELAQQCTELARQCAITEQQHAEEKEKEQANGRVMFRIAGGIIGIIIGLFLLIAVGAEATKSNSYNRAVNLYQTGKYNEAYKIFNTMPTYKDSESRAEKCLNAIESESSYSNQKNDLPGVKTGDVIKFGLYEQDNDYSNGKEEIEWIVLTVEQGRALVLSKYVLDCQPYHITERDGIMWEESDFRWWLNNIFFDDAFGLHHQKRIPSVTIVPDENSKSNSNLYPATEDKIFLLSIKEVNRYLTSASDILCRPTAFAKSLGVKEYKEGYCDWWLRSPKGGRGYMSIVVGYPSNILNSTRPINQDDVGVRPAMWIELN